MSTSGPNFVARVASRIGRGLRAARRPWVVVLGLVYFAGDLACIGSRDDWRDSLVASAVNVHLIGKSRGVRCVMPDDTFITYPDGHDDPIKVLSKNTSWDETIGIVEKSLVPAYMVTSTSTDERSCLYAPMRRVWTFDVVVYDMRANVELIGAARDRILNDVREWNRTSLARFGLEPVSVNAARRTEWFPLGILHNALSLAVWVLVVNGVPSVTIGAWKRRRAARRMARGQCTACGYEFGAATIDRCPECGLARAAQDDQ